MLRIPTNISVLKQTRMSTYQDLGFESYLQPDQCSHYPSHHTIQTAIVIKSTISGINFIVTAKPPPKGLLYKRFTELTVKILYSN